MEQRSTTVEQNANAARALAALMVAEHAVRDALEAEMKERCGINSGQFQVLMALAGAPDGQLRMADIAATNCISGARQNAGNAGCWPSAIASACIGQLFKFGPDHRRQRRQNGVPPRVRQHKGPRRRAQRLCHGAIIDQRKHTHGERRCPIGTRNSM